MKNYKCLRSGSDGRAGRASSPPMGTSKLQIFEVQKLKRKTGRLAKKNLLQLKL